MDYLEAKINQLVVESKTKPKTFTRTFVTKPSRGLLAKMGKIFGLIEIKSQDPKIPELIDLIIEEIKNNYYQDDNKIQQNDLAISERFEAALKKINLMITSFLESEQISLDLEKVNIIIALSLNQDIHFTLVGDMGMILFHNLSPHNYRIINILETTQSPLTTPDPLKFFSQIFSGKIRPRDILLIATANIFDYFSLEKMKNIITGKVTAESIIELNETLKNLGGKEIFGVLTLELEKISVQVTKPIVVNMEKFNYHQAASHDSIKELINTERETQKLLTPSFLPELKKYIISFNIAFKNYLKKIKSQTASVYQNKKMIIKPATNFTNKLNLGKKIQAANKISTYPKKILQPIIPFFKKIINRISQNSVWDKISPLIKKITNYFLTKFNRLPKSNKRLLIITFGLVILLSFGLIWLSYSNKQIKRNENFNQIVSDVENKKNEAEASLIYRDENQARQILIDAKNSLASLQPTNDAQKEQLALLNSQIENQLQQLRHLIEVSEPIQLLNFQNLDNNAKIANFAVMAGKTIYTQNNNQSIYKANINTRIISAIYSPTVKTDNLSLGTRVSDNELVFLNSSNNALKLNPSNDTLQPVMINIGSGAKIADLTAFKDRLYLLDTTASQIYRYAKSGNGWGNATNWITEAGINLSDAKSLVVDGSVYILKSDGQIIKLESGKIVDFKINIIEPKLEAPTRIKTFDTSKYLYILDPPTKRLVVIDKTGKLIAQYTSASFTDLKDFIVSEPDKTIYFLAGSSIYGVPADHLK